MRFIQFLMKFFLYICKVCNIMFCYLYMLSLHAQKLKGWLYDLNR